MGNRERQVAGTEAEIKKIPEIRTFVPILINPKAGARGRFHRVLELAEGLRKSGLQPELFSDRGALITRLQADSASQETRCVVAAGGDGTVGWLVNQQLRVPIAIFPVGSENLLARHFGIQRRAPFAVRMIRDGHLRILDLGSVNGRRFTVMASCGLDSEVVDRVHANRQGHVSRWHYAVAIASSLRGGTREPLRIWVDDEKDPLIAHHAFFFNVAAYALGLPVCPDAKPDDALLDMVIYPGQGIWNLGRYIWEMLRPRGGELSDRICRRIRKARLECAGPKPLQIDGDPAGNLPAEIVALPGALQLIVPALPSA